MNWQRNIHNISNRVYMTTTIVSFEYQGYDVITLPYCHMSGGATLWRPAAVPSSLYV